MLAGGQATATVFTLEGVMLANGGATTGWFQTDGKPFDQATVVAWDLNSTSVSVGSFFSGPTNPFSNTPQSTAYFTVTGENAPIYATQYAQPHQPTLVLHNVLGTIEWITLAVDASAQIDAGVIPLNVAHDLNPYSPARVLGASIQGGDMTDMAMISGSVRASHDPIPTGTVPEPTTYAMLLVGVLALYVIRVLRRAHHAPN
jgi:hypothetical protein